jgi:GntR family transcriptional repressor for pyruvate dehydrogenase complex
MPTYNTALAPEEERGAPIAVEGLVGRAMRAVTDHIRDEGLKAGDPMPSEAAFAESLATSRTVVREAFRALSAVGVIDVGNGRRARVGAIDDSVLSMVVDHAVRTQQISIQQVLDLRRSIELRSASLAAMRRSVQESEEIAGLAGQMRAALGDFPLMADLDIAFHQAIARATRNPMYAIVIGSFRTVMQQTCPIGWFSRPTQAERVAVIEMHETIAEAIRRQDPQAAERAMADHFDLSIKALVAAGIN